jgi:hypothetical protein
MLREMFNIQTQLNRSIGFPGTFETREELMAVDENSRVRNAIVAEIGEAMQATKPSWAWWRKAGDDSEMNREKVAGELIDVMFFLLSYVDQMQSAAYEEARIMDLLPMPLIPSDLHERLEIVASTLDMLELGLYDEKGQLTADVFVQQLRSEGISSHEIINTMLRATLHAVTSPSFDGEAFQTTMMRLLCVWFALGMDLDDLWAQYHAKARINLERWKSARILVVNDLAYEALLDDIDDQAALPLPIAKENQDGHARLKIAAEAAHQRIANKAIEHSMEVLHDDRGNPLLN